MFQMFFDADFSMRSHPAASPCFRQSLSQGPIRVLQDLSCMMCSPSSLLSGHTGVGRTGGCGPSPHDAVRQDRRHPQRACLFRGPESGRSWAPVSSHHPQKGIEPEPERPISDLDIGAPVQLQNVSPSTVPTRLSSRQKNVWYSRFVVLTGRSSIKHWLVIC